MKHVLAAGLAFLVLLAGCATPAQPAAGHATFAATSTSPAAPPPASPLSSSLSSTPSTSTPAAQGNLTVAFVDIGQGAAMVLRFPDSLVVLDAANRFVSSTDPLLVYLRAIGATRIDHLLITNPDADHAGGCNELFRDYEVRAFYHPGNPKDTQTWQECLDAAAAEGVSAHTDADLNPGDLLPLSAHATARLLNVDAQSSTINAGSLALRVDYGQTSWIFSGDIDCTTEDAIRGRGYDLDVDFLQAAHHGSKSSTCAPWLQATSPQAVFIPVGTNSYGHPTPETLQRIQDAGAAVYRTDLHGTITITTDGQGSSIQTTKQPPAPAPSPSPAPTPAPSPSPPPAAAPASLVVTATAVPSQPCRYSNVEIHVTVQDGAGTGVAGAGLTSSWYYKTTTSHESGSTDSSGEGVLERYISSATAGYTVQVSVQASKNGAAGSDSTSFTPRNC